MKHLTYSKELLEPVVLSSLSYTEVARKLGRKPVGGTLTNINLMCRRYQIDTSHMTGQAHNKGKRSPAKRNPIEWLVMGSPNDHRQYAKNLRAGLIALGIELKCIGCGNKGEWLNKPLTLEINHKDGQYWNNTPENLEFVCPNCHSQK